MPPDEVPPVPLEKVLSAELEEIRKARKLRGITDLGANRPAAAAPEAPIAGKAAPREPEWQNDEEAADWVSAVRSAHEANLVGLAFSGGGIRSATFNLGVLQGLAELKLLHRVDYLSTVSGGGYIGGWLAAWIKRVGSFGKVQKYLATNRVHQDDDKEPTPIRFLRVFSNYLTPKLGIFSGDTLAMISIYLRNLLLNQIVVLAVLTAVLLVPRLLQRWAVGAVWTSATTWYWLSAGAILLLIVFLIILNNMAYLDCRDEGGARQITKQSWILLLAAAPLFAVGVLGALWQVVRFGESKCENRVPLPSGKGAMYGAIAYAAIWALATVAGIFYRWWLAPIVSKMGEKFADLSGRDRPQTGSPASASGNATAKNSAALNGKAVFDFFVTWAGAFGAGALAGWLYALLSTWTLCWTPKGALTAGAPLVLGIFLLAGALHIGLMGTVFHDRAREWWGRLGGWLILWGIIWLVIFSVALYFPDFFLHSTLVKALKAKYLTLSWIATTVGGVLAGNSKASGNPGTLTWKDVVAKAGPYAFIAGLLCWISYGIQRVQQLNVFNSLYTAMFLCIGVAVVMAWRVDVNQFSMHLFYRNRLARCYLGASNEGRSPNRFTGFDRTDDMPLKDLRVDTKIPYDGPYPVLNMSLNLVKGKDLAWQERMAESFVMTPQYCGFDVWLEEQDSPMMRQQRPLTKEEEERRRTEERNSIVRRWLRRLDRFGYRRTDLYAFPPPFNGPNLGLAMGISGAAASPNMGSYSSPPVAFLLTLFDVRLGQWLGNPRHRGTWRRATPIFGLTYLLNELFAGTDDEAGYVYLSDGGHFENLGLYELVKRRCGLIIVCDAEADGGYGFGGLGNAIRKCRIDLGIDIQLDVSEIAPPKPGEPSAKHCAIGTIHYETVDIKAPTGTIIYFKASLTGDESTDIKNYNRTHGTFPHESTDNQWFTESQFESYRQLGYHEVVTAIRMKGPLGTPSGGAAGPSGSSTPNGPSGSAGPGPGLGVATAASPISTTTATVAKVATMIQAAAAAVKQEAERLSGPKADTAEGERVIEDKKAAPSIPLDIQLRDILDSFGFQTSTLRESREKTS